MNRSLNLQVIKELEGTNVAARDFKALKSAMRKQFKDIDISEGLKDISEQGSDAISRASGDDFKVEIQQASGIGVLEEDPTQLTFGMEMDLGVSSSEGAERVKGYVTGCFLRIHGKAINLYCNSNVSNSTEEKQWALETIRSWRKAIVSSNQKLAAEAAKEPRANLGNRPWYFRILAAAVIGAIAGGLFGLFKAISKRGKEEG